MEFLEGLTGYFIAFAILINAIVSFRKEIMSLFKKRKPSIAKTIYNERIWLAEIALDRCKNKMREHFRTLVSDIDQRKKFVEVTGESFNIGHEFIEELLVNNHFDDKSHTEYKEYITDRKMDVVNEISVAIDGKYDDAFFDIPRKDLFESNQEIVPYCLKQIEKFFWSCRSQDSKARKTFMELDE